MPNFIKNQWFRLVVGTLCIVVACIYAFQPAKYEEGTIEYLDQAMGALFSAGLWFISSLIWFIMAMVEHNSDCIKALDKRTTQLENRAVTDIDKVDSNNYVVRRRLGPDKEVPFPTWQEDQDERYSK